MAVRLMCFFVISVGLPRKDPRIASTQQSLVCHIRRYITCAFETVLLHSVRINCNPNL